MFNFPIQRVLRVPSQLSFIKMGMHWLIWEQYSRLFASTHGDHTVKIVDFTTGRILRVQMLSSLHYVDIDRSSSNALDGEIPPEKPGYYCEWLYWFRRYCLGLEEERDSRYNSDHAELDDHLPWLASHVFVHAFFHSKRRVHFDSLWNDCVYLGLPEEHPFQSLSFQRS